MNGFMNRRSFFRWATATGAALFLPGSVRPTRVWSVTDAQSMDMYVQFMKAEMIAATMLAVESSACRLTTAEISRIGSIGIIPPMANH